MKIAPLRERLSFHVRQIVQDEIGNETSTWILFLNGGALVVLSP